MMDFILNYSITDKSQFFKLLKKHFTHKIEWLDAYGKNAEFNLQKFLDSLLCKNEEQEIDAINFKRIEIFCVYTCS